MLAALKRQDGGIGAYAMGSAMLIFALTIAMINLTFAQLTAFRTRLSAVAEAGVEAAALRIQADVWRQENKVRLDPEKAKSTFMQVVAENLKVQSACLNPNGQQNPNCIEVLQDVSARFRIVNADTGLVEGTIESTFRFPIPLLDQMAIRVPVSYRSRPAPCRTEQTCG